jgi:hypothetical protein
MWKIKLAVAAAAVAAGMLAPILVAGTANASTYTYSEIGRYAIVGPHDNEHTDGFQLWAYSTYSQTQVWINGSVFCSPTAGSVNIGWHGVGGGNGTGALNIGCNFTFSGIKGSYYERMNIYAGGAGCSTWGSNADGNGVDLWENEGVVCEAPA